MSKRKMTAEEADQLADHLDTVIDLLDKRRLQMGSYSSLSDAEKQVYDNLLRLENDLFAKEHALLIKATEIDLKNGLADLDSLKQATAAAMKATVVLKKVGNVITVATKLLLLYAAIQTGGFAGIAGAAGEVIDSVKELEDQEKPAAA